MTDPFLFVLQVGQVVAWTTLLVAMAGLAVLFYVGLTRAFEDEWAVANRRRYDEHMALHARHGSCPPTAPCRSARP